MHDLKCELPGMIAAWGKKGVHPSGDEVGLIREATRPVMCACSTRSRRELRPGEPTFNEMKVMNENYLNFLVGLRMGKKVKIDPPLSKKWGPETKAGRVIEVDFRNRRRL